VTVSALIAIDDIAMPPSRWQVVRRQPVRRQRRTAARQDVLTQRGGLKINEAAMAGTWRTTAVLTAESAGCRQPLDRGRVGVRRRCRRLCRVRRPGAGAALRCPASHTY